MYSEDFFQFYPEGIIMAKRKNYIFTNRKHSEKAIMSTALGTLCIFSLIMVVYLSYKKAGDAPTGYGFTGLFVMLFSLVGMILGIVTVREKEMFKLFPILGIILNVIAFLGVGFLVYIGNYR